MKKDVKNIKSLISLKEEWWVNDLNTNCYAFALGLDVPESEICDNAYQLGFIAAEKFGLSLEDILDLSFEERFLLDLKAMKIAYHEVSETSIAGWYNLGNYICNYWDVVMFSNNDGFHFVRRNYNGQLFHKVGYLGLPFECSFDNSFFKKYDLVKKYRLRYWEKADSFN